MADTEFTPVPGTQVYPFTSGDRAIEFFSKHETVLLSVFHPASPQWGLFSPTYNELAMKLSTMGIKTATLNIDDGDAVQDLVRKLLISRVPTLVLFNGPDNFKVYRGILREKEILEFLHRQKLPPVSEVDAVTLEKLREENSVVVAGFFGPDDSTLRDQFAAAANALKDEYVFATTADNAEGVSVPSIIISKKTPEERTVLSTWDSEETLQSLIKTAATPLIVEFLPELYADFLSGPTPLLGYIILPSLSLSVSPDTHTAFLPLARAHASKILFGTVIGPENPRITSNMLVPEDTYPFFVLHDVASNLKYHLPLPAEGPIPVDAISAFIDSYFAGGLDPVMKSEPIPAQTSPLIEVVGLTFKDIVFDDEKDVFIEYYDPDCAPCLTLVPQLEKFAGAVAVDERGAKLVTVAKMDLDANDALDSDIRGFPTIKVYPAGRKDKPVQYNAEQGHSVEKWAKFLKEVGAHGVEVKA
ncbi:hypothetical protein B0T16DRAFT_491967 [Cercophora newfieldiana]|uniref:Protein disulfide-isomerase n=1 Tax=Cercophora newfieldiana TaxID=92897 RepID=A0AA39YCF1_9PEZI|nr:hypothetical protein B0T16DRAFT_491967 [Cercophora newfieldiana]